MLNLRERMEEKDTAPPPGRVSEARQLHRTRRWWISRSGGSSPHRTSYGSSKKRTDARSPGEVGRLLRREGLYTSHLTAWRKAARTGSLKALSKKRGRKAERNPLEEKVRKLERENVRLEKELHKAHLIIDVQGKVAGLLGLNLEDGTNS